MKKTMIGLLAVILCCVGIYKITQLPPGLTYDLRGTYTEDLPEGAGSFTYLSVDYLDFHYFNENTGEFLYGTYEQTGENAYLLEGKHIEKQTVSLNREHKLVLTLDGKEVRMKKISNPTSSVNGSWEKAKDNDRKTKEQMTFVPEEEVNHWIFEGTYGCLEEDGTLSVEEPYRFVPDDLDFWLYNEKNGFYAEGKLEKIDSGREYVIDDDIVERQHIFPQKNGFVLTLGGKELVFVKITDKQFVPEQAME